MTNTSNIDFYMKCSRPQRIFLSRYERFMKLLDWSNEHYDQANIGRFKHNVERPMEEAWDVLSDTEKDSCMEMLR